MSSISHHRRAASGRRQGFALVLVLAFVVLLTVIILAFFSNSLLQRQVADSSANQTKADLFAQGALDAIVGDLKQEIVDGSTSTSMVTGAATNTVYYPTTAANMVPYRAGSNTSWTNLVKRSANGVGFYPSGGGYAQSGPLRAANCNTTTSSLNGRYYTPARWNPSLLLPPASATDFTPNTATTFIAPDWILVAQDGSNPTAWNSNMRASPLQTTTVTGRYAYCVYDEGGLLDMNVAGYPSTPADSQVLYKNAEAYADLTQLTDSLGNSYLTQAQINAIVNWRNAASLQQTPLPGMTAYGSYVFSNLTGFLSTSNTSLTTTGALGQSDRMFTSRGQLLSFFSNNLGGGFALDNALQYLTHFSRDVNAPSWIPTTPSGIAANSTYDYAYHANDSTAANRTVMGVRISTSFSRPDGTTARVGEPLLKHRFPLSRLAGLTYQGIDTTDKTTLLNGVLSAATAATIQRDFGLKWVAGTHSGSQTDLQNADHWAYVGPTGSTVLSSIATLGTVASAGREPNFFELLKAAMLAGSLGRDAGLNGTFLANYEQGPASGEGPYLVPPSTVMPGPDNNVDSQVIQIGANIIDQSDTDSYPTEIHFVDVNNSSGNTETAFYGIENLPYLQRVFAKTLFPFNDPSSAHPSQNVGGWYMAELWNPHQNWGATSTVTPTQFKFCGSGLTEMWNWPSAGKVYASPLNLANSGSLAFTVPSTGSLREATLLSKDSSNGLYLTPTVNSGVNGTNDPYGNQLVAGLYAGDIDASQTGDGNSNAPGAWGGFAPQGCSLILQYLSPSGYYANYDVMKNLTAQQQSDTAQMCYYYQHVDPRTDRFGTTLGRWQYPYDSVKNPSGPPTTINPPGASLRVDNSQGSNGYDYFPLSSSGFIYTSGTTPGSNSSIFNNYYMGTLSDNSPSAVPTVSNPYYSDLDGIVRPAEGAYATGTFAIDTNSVYDGRPLVPGNPTSRPIILNRPFRSVGELGYAFRDDPWKEVDFFTSSSGDAALMDMFCVNESESSPGSALVAGAVNLNTHQAPVLQAIIAGAVKDATASSTVSGAPTTNSDAQVAAKALVNFTATTPLQNRADLITKAASIMMGSAASISDQQIKFRRESALRALSNVGTARTWTLMIDVIAQVGRYPQGASSLSQFLVEGEKRYWLHISIDRYTGQVIDRSLEPVYE